MTRLPSLDAVISGARRTLARFPFVFVAAFVATASAILALDTVGPEAFHWRLLAAATLGIPLFIATTLYGERLAASHGRLVLPTLGLAGLVAFYLAWPAWSDSLRVGRYVQASAACHLLVAVLPFLGRNEPNGFWQYNKALFLRFLTAGLYSGVLYAGLALALAAVDQLFGVGVPENGYARLWFVAAFMFNTWVFLAGVPDDLGALEQQRGYPGGLRAFTQYALVPLVVIYLVILTVYFGKIVITWDWPSGWIGWLVSSVAGVGILTVLLVHPIAEEPSSRWIGKYARGFYVALLPAIVMLWLAISQRIGQYGITERRYFLLVLSVWLAAIAVYYAVTQSRNIRIIPASLVVVAIVTFAGPWGAYAFSERSQTRRLEALLQTNALLVDGRAQRATASVTFEDRREISEILRYLLETHGGSAIAPWFRDSAAIADTLGIAATSRGAAGRQASRIVASLGVAYVDRWQRAPERDFTYRSEWDDAVVPVTGFDFLVSVGRARAGAAIDTGIVALPVPRRQVVQLRRHGDVLVELDLTNALTRAHAFAQDSSTHLIPGEMMRVSTNAGSVRAVLLISRLHGVETETGLRLEEVGGRVLLGFE